MDGPLGKKTQEVKHLSLVAIQEGDNTGHHGQHTVTLGRGSWGDVAGNWSLGLNDSHQSNVCNFQNAQLLLCQLTMSANAGV